MTGRETTHIASATVGPGTTLNGIFAIDEKLAAGGMGEVYRGHNIATGDPVAIKVVLRELAKDETIIGLFFKEAKILNSLHHPAIVRYSVFTVDPVIERPYLVMEFVDGLSLADVIDGKPMSVSDTKLLISRLASGLDTAHRAGVIHRDISPDNVILAGGKVIGAKIIDFGIARASNVGTGTLLGGKFAGKYNFVSPEQLGLFGGEVTDVSDIYSLGLLTVNALQGRAIDMNGTQFEVIEKRRSVPDLSKIDPDLRPILELMLQPNPADRKLTMADISDWLEPEAERPRSSRRPTSSPREELTVIASPQSASDTSSRDAVLPDLAAVPATHPPVERAAESVMETPPAEQNAAERTMLAMPRASVPPELEELGFGSLATQDETAKSVSVPPSQATVIATPLAASPAAATTTPAPQAVTAEEHDPIASIRIEAGQAPAAPDTFMPPAQAEAGAHRPADRWNWGSVAAAVLLLILGGGGAAYLSGMFSAQPDPLIAARDQAPNLQPSTRAEPAGQTLQLGNQSSGTAKQSSSAPPAAPPPIAGPANNNPTSQPVNPAPDAMKSAEPDVAINLPLRPAASMTDVGEKLDWLQKFEGGDCFFVRPVMASADGMSIEGMSHDVAPFKNLEAGFKTKFGMEPNIEVRSILETQCSVANFLKTLSGSKLPTLKITLNSDRIKSGQALSGTLESLTKSNTVLYLIDNDGFVYQIDQFMKRDKEQGKFSIKLVELATRQPLAQVVLALSSDKPIKASALPEPTTGQSLFPRLLQSIQSENVNVDVGFAFFLLGGS